MYKRQELLRGLREVLLREFAQALPRAAWRVVERGVESRSCLLYTSDAADDLLCVDLGGRRIIKKKTTEMIYIES